MNKKKKQKMESPNPKKVFPCSICNKKFSNKKYIRTHTRKVHKFELRVDGYVVCPLNGCKQKFSSYACLRKHFPTHHQVEIESEEYHFGSKAEFLSWKDSKEKSDKESYVQSSTKKVADGSMRLYYACYRSGMKVIPKVNRKRAPRFQVCNKIGGHCASTMDVHVKESGVRVVYYKTHVGHDVGLKDLTMNNLERSALAKCPSGDVLFNDLLEDVRENLTSETVVPYALRKRDTRILTKAFETDEYDLGLSDSESVHRWVSLCLQEDDSPVLYFKQEDLPDGKEEFLLIIMTEFQKQLLVSSDKSVICVDCVHRRKGRRLYLSSIYIMDECEAAFPVAFCISHKVDSNVIRQFLTSVKKTTGPLSYTYFMSESESFYFDVWREVMDDNAIWLWSMWYVDYDIKRRLQNFFKDERDKKAEIYKTMRTLIECQSQNIFEATFKKFHESLLDDTLLEASRKFGEALSEKYAPNMELWAYCYRTSMKLGANFQLDVLHRTLRFCCKEGNKSRLDKFIFVLMKYLKVKMMDRLKNILDDEKIEMVLETINECHKAAMQISPERITSLSDKIWMVKSEDDEDRVFVVRDFDSCPEYCKLRCLECDICIHMYSCSCIPSLINANLCQHIHAIVWKLLTPHHFSPCPSPGVDDCDMPNADSDSDDSSPAPNKSHSLLGSALKMSHDIYKSIVENKLNLNDQALNVVMQKLSEVKVCIDTYSGKGTISGPQNISFVTNSVFSPSSQNSVLQPLVFQTIQQPNIQANLPNIQANLPNIQANSSNVQTNSPNIQAKSPNIPVNSPNIKPICSMPSQAQINSPNVKPICPKLSQSPLAFPQNTPLPQQYIIYVQNTMPTIKKE